MAKARATFGGELRRRREAAGLSVLQLARAAGCNRQTIYYAEANVNSPSLNLVLRLAECLGIDVCDLIGPLRPPRPPVKRMEG